MKCRHEWVISYAWVVGQWDAVAVWLGPAYIARVGARRCSDCGAWLPLGPANDGGEHASAVAVEIRAAELAAALRDGHAANNHKRAGLFYSVLGFDGAEAAGHIAWAVDSAKVPEQDGEWAGWLCGYIASKEQP